MFNSIRTKLTVTYLILILAVMVLTSIFLLNILEQYYLAYHSDALAAAANVAASFSAGYLKATPDVVAISTLAEDFARPIRSRVIITDHRQRVLGDSLRIGGLVGTTLEREEIAAALNGEIGSSIQYSEQSRVWVMQVAVPIESDGTLLGSVFISSDLSPIYQILTDIRKFLLLATALALVLAGFLGIVFADRVTVPIETLTTATERMARGDLSQRVTIRSKDEIGRLATQFNNMASRVQEMTRQLREFVANASHEMRTPLTSMNILVKSLREYPLDAAEREEFLSDVDKELERLIHLVESLLDLTRLDRLATEDTMYLVDIVPTVQNTLEMLRKRAEGKKILLEYMLPERTAPVFVVLHQIKQVVFNLVDNAIKYTPAEGKISVTLTQEPEKLVLAVSDTGSGIPPEHREKIFERFYRVDKARSREQGGTGLGLAIVREIVKKHGGDVWVETADGGGARFVVTLPRVPGQETEY